jgi:Chitobiase/beta-hexosaminidase C-terminal domain
MRIAVVLLPLTLSAALVQAQDPGMMAAQQAAQIANQQTMIATQQAMQAAQQANDAAQRASQLAIENAQTMNTLGYVQAHTAKPKFSVKPGTYSARLQVKIRDSSRRAVIYYTTDGWTPTAESTRYTGPITIDSATTLQAIAIAPQAARSRVASATYTLNGAPTATSQKAAPGAGAEPVASPDASGKVVLPRGMVVPLVFASDLNSKTADVGDRIALSLAEDIKVGDTILVRKGAAAVGKVTETDKSHGLGVPGEIIFSVESLAADGTVIKLHGSAAKEGQDKYGTAAALVLPIGPWGLLEHGEEAEIKSGTPFRAYVDADTVLVPGK